ncbi:MAG: GrpB family protein [Betaproteobacteria bacterium]|nr:MAG: GrpB family protein [Betaproteobacteria bacterium]
MSVRVVAPDPDWLISFAIESQRIRGAVGGNVVALHHIGSTAIAEIYAKPIVDMLLVVADFERLDGSTAALTEMGYKAMGEFGIPGRRYFRKDGSGGLRTHHLHSFVVGHSAVDRHLAFRDYMNANPSAAQVYCALKRNLAAQHPNSMDADMDGKDAFIKQHETIALAWRRSLTDAK